ncbi:hypothetical protein [Thalassotalea fusca]
MKKLVLVLATLFTLLIASLVSMYAMAQTDHLETLYGVSRSDDNLHIKVRSFGCTQAESFVIEQKKQGLAILRIKPDNCRRMPHIIDVVLPLPERLDAFVLLNPFAGRA